MPATKWGIKVFVLSDAHNGYVKNLQIYTGKGVESRDEDVGLCTRVVLDLMSHFAQSGWHVDTDNVYTSPTLYQHLYKYGINGLVPIQGVVFPQTYISRLQRIIVVTLNVNQMVPLLGLTNVLLIFAQRCM